jgi:hypothetical protein
MSQIGQRLKQLIAHRTDDRIRYVQLESLTGVSAERWKNFWFGRKKADAEMIEAASKAWPENAFWLASGITDVEFGHVAGDPADTFPEAPRRQGMPASVEFFRASIRARACAVQCKVELESAGDSGINDLASIPRIAIGAWKKGKDIPQLAQELRERMYELDDRRNARKQEVGLRPELAAILDTIQFNFDPDKLLRQVADYKRRRGDELFADDNKEN